MICEVGRTVFKFQESLIGSALVVLCEIFLGDYLRCKLQDDQSRLPKSLINLFLP